jgi:hypothetical protein
MSNAAIVDWMKALFIKVNDSLHSEEKQTLLKA